MLMLCKQITEPVGTSPYSWIICGFPYFCVLFVYILEAPNTKSYDTNCQICTPLHPLRPGSAQNDRHQPVSSPHPTGATFEFGLFGRLALRSPPDPAWIFLIFSLDLNLPFPSFNLFLSHAFPCVFFDFSPYSLIALAAFTLFVSLSTSLLSLNSSAS